jgi:hypothetical protein
MGQNEFSASPSRSDGDHIGRNRLNGLIAVLVGLNQLTVAAMSENELALFIGGAGGWLLIAIGVSVFRGKEAFEIDWSESERVAWLITIMQLLLPLGVAAVAILFILA